MTMEQVPVYLCLTLSLLLLPLLLYKNKHKRRRRDGASAGKRLPPGPSRLPVIGSLPHFIVGPPDRCCAACLALSRSLLLADQGRR